MPGAAFAPPPTSPTGPNASARPSSWGSSRRPWSRLQLAAAGRWDAGYLPGLARSYLIPGYLLFWVWVVARGEGRAAKGPEARFPV